jgi:hypothetical protein
VGQIKYLSADQNLQRLAFTNTLTMANPMGEYATWLLTGTATIIGAILVNIENVSKILSISALHWGLTFLVSSMLIGVFVKQCGIGIASGVSTMDTMYSEMEKPAGQEMLQKLTLNTEDFKEAMSSAFLWPISIIVKKACEKSATDFLASEKRLIKLLCVQIYLIWAQGIFGMIGLLILAFGIGNNI